MPAARKVSMMRPSWPTLIQVTVSTASPTSGSDSPSWATATTSMPAARAVRAKISGKRPLPAMSPMRGTGARLTGRRGQSRVGGWARHYLPGVVGGAMHDGKDEKKSGSNRVQDAVRKHSREATTDVLVEDAPSCCESRIDRSRPVVSLRSTTGYRSRTLRDAIPQGCSRSRWSRPQADTTGSGRSLYRYPVSSASSAFASIRSRVSKPSVNHA